MHVMIRMNRILLLGLLVFRCCQAVWPFLGFHNVENKRLLEGKSEIDAILSERLTALESKVAEAQKAREEAQKAREEAQEEVRAVEERLRSQFAVVEKKLLQLTAVNRNFCMLAERLDESHHRERRPAKLAETSKIIGATLDKVSEITMPVCNSWYEASKYAREIHRNV